MKFRDEEGFYIFISELAQHTLNLQQHSNAGVMFIQDEAESPNLFARPRVTFNCDVSVIEPGDQRYDSLLLTMEQELGKVVGVLRSLSDFRLFKLQPTRGRFVAGFGTAFDIDPVDSSLTAVDATRKLDP
ncbi:MAG: pyridoxamine 5'-phosphate oxidase family protein [Amphritea sp.]